MNLRHPLPTLHLRVLLFTALAVLAISSSKAQEFTATPDEPSFFQKLRYGGGLGINFGDGYFLGSVSPIAVYPVNQYFSAGLGANVSYQSQRDAFSSWTYGPSLILLGNPVREIQLSAELEQYFINQNFDDRIGGGSNNFDTTALWLGAGYRTGNIILGARYNVLFNEDDDRIFNSGFAPFVRFWF